MRSRHDVLSGTEPARLLPGHAVSFVAYSLSPGPGGSAYWMKYYYLMSINLNFRSIATHISMLVTMQWDLYHILDSLYKNVSLQ